MPSMADKLGFGPKRVATQLESGNWRIDVTPPAFVNLPTQSVELTPNQMERYRSWREGDLLVQDAFPDLTAAQREILLTGIGDKDFHELFPEE